MTTTAPGPVAQIHCADLKNCTVRQLRDLAATHLANPQDAELIAAELENRGLDPYA
jgi:hypothetical protein